MSNVKFQIADLLTRLNECWWTPYPPSRYMRNVNSIGHFNLYWAITGKKPAPFQQREFNTAIWLSIGKLCELEYKGGTVGELALLLKPEEFYIQVVKPWDAKHLIWEYMALIASKRKWTLSLVT